jgi:hypothetical protein
MRCGREHCHIDADLSDESPPGNSIHTRGRVPARHRFGQFRIRSPDLFQAFIQELDFLLDEAPLCQQTFEQESVMLAHYALYQSSAPVS